MPGFVFDANVLKNFIATGLSPLLAQLCPVPRHVPTVVWKDELERLARSYARLHGDLPADDLATYVDRLNNANATLQDQGFTEINVFKGTDVAEQAFLVCVLDDDRIDPGEAECLAIAAYRGDTVYSDDYAFKRIVDALNCGTTSCPRDGVDPPPHLPIVVHGTVRILLDAVDQGLLPLPEAERAYATMREAVGSRLPDGTLHGLRGGSHDW